MRQGNLCEFKASLINIVNSRTANRETLAQKQTKDKKKNMTESLRLGLSGVGLKQWRKKVDVGNEFEV